MSRLAKIDLGEKLVPALGADAALYLIAIPVIMLFYAAFHGPSDYLPLPEAGSKWTWDNLQQRLQRSDPLWTHPSSIR